MLFATLAPTSTTPHPSSHPPTAVQLHTDKLVDFTTETVSTSSGGHEVLTYQPVEVYDRSSSTTPGTPAGGGGDAASPFRNRPSAKHLRPNLGVWNCRVTPSSSASTEEGGGVGSTEETDDEKKKENLVDLLLRRVMHHSEPRGEEKKEGDGDGDTENATNGSSSTYILTVDLSDPSGVEPTVRSMRDAILHQLDTAGGGGGEGTSWEMLSSATFGLAPDDDAPPPSPSAKDDGEGGGGGKANLILAAILPPPSATGTYKDKQSQSLLTYHLHRFANALDCTLVYVSPASGFLDSATEEEEIKEGGEGGQESLTVEELGRLVRRVCLTGSPVEDEEEEAVSAPVSDAPKDEEAKEGGNEEEKAETKEGEGTDESPLATVSGVSIAEAVYPPGKHDLDLIESVLLRNASCPGEWDATTDSIWKALPTADKVGTSDGPKTPKKQQVAHGDEEWLSKLANSVAGGMEPTAKPAEAASGAKPAKTSPAKDAKKKEPGSKEKKEEKSDVAVSSFFENLLKK